jgi:hydroxyacylglutathione hydrolase
MFFEVIRTEIQAISFAPESGDFATWILVLRDNDRALLIDSGYERHAAAVIDHLGDSVRVDSVVLSHEHEDHAYGCRELPEAEVLGAEGFPEDVLVGRAVTEIADGARIRFGDHELSFRITPGHSRYHLTTLIDEAVAHVGDLLIFTHEGRPTPPYLSDAEALDDHVRSLEWVKGLAPEILVPGHGPVLRGREEIAGAVDLRLHYLRALGDASCAVGLEECWPVDVGEVGRHDFHEMNLGKLGMG